MTLIETVDIGDVASVLVVLVDVSEVRKEATRHSFVVCLVVQAVGEANVFSNIVYRDTRRHATARESTPDH